ncbi:hypothetical protein [Saccharothrix lopnurensis]|uniref:Uncharacterized protein n=1 Tax=Saccharothrix lopnurensis TaxID=1670621 RepID=A0ABW1P4S6_9PSEU
MTTVVDRSHGLRTTEHAEAAVDALRSVPGRFVPAYGNTHRPPGVWATRGATASSAASRWAAGPTWWCSITTWRSRCSTRTATSCSQAQRDHLHTALVGGRVVKREHRLVGVDLQAVRRAVEHLRRGIGEAAWQEGVDLPV